MLPPSLYPGRGRPHGNETPRSFVSEEGLARNLAEEELEEGQSLLYALSRPQGLPCTRQHFRDSFQNAIDT